MANVRLNGVVKRFGNYTVLNAITLAVEDGEFCVFVGPSGCGKSTLLRMIAGLESINEGEVEIGGRVVNQLPPVERDVAMVFQDYALYPHMTVERNLSFSLRMRGVARAAVDERVRRTAEILQINELLSRKPKALSGGQRQRVAMGRAMIREPKAFLFDEPLSNLDAKLRGDVRTEIKQLHQRLRATMIYVTHDQVEAMTLADRIVVLRSGNVEQIGSPAELYRYPATAFVAGFIGSPAMNLLQGTVTPDSAGLRVVLPPDCTLVLPAENVNAIGLGREVLLGVRPEELALCDPHVDGLALRGRVDLVEPLGADTMVLVRVGTQSVMVRVKPSLRVSHGEFVGAAINPSNWSLFDGKTRQALHHA